MQLLDGKSLANILLEEIKAEVEVIKISGGKIPHLAAVLVGNDGGSETYVASKMKNCETAGFKSSLKRFDLSISESQLLQAVNELNEDDDVDGFIVQLPLPKHFNSDKVLELIRPEKDVDGFHPVNIGRMTQGLPAYIPATPFGILKLLERNKIETSGKHCVILGRSNIVGTPMGILMSRNTYPGNCTVTVCHSATKNIKEISLQADILIAAIGKPGFVSADLVKDGAVVIDVGTTRIADDSKKSGFRLQGDVKFDEVSPKCSWITPVPGGVGPMTVISLLMNTLKAAKKEIYLFNN